MIPTARDYLVAWLETYGATVTSTDGSESYTIGTQRASEYLLPPALAPCISSTRPPPAALAPGS